uniref:Retinol dehydrogenase 11 n=2 Tax=Lepeophtheirus salmonis TaxID=72036 RepID=D3PJY0_LEPSM|nr:Retinol dehydrogenase 11 [Lepeophtheirus salmonis]
MTLKDDLPSWPTTIGVGLLAGGALFLYAVRRSVSSKWGSCIYKNMDIKGKTVIITGANTGLGYDAALTMADRNAKLILACRNSEKGNKAVQTIIQKTGNADVRFMELDLASLTSIEKFANEYLSKDDKLDVLLCNAGVWFPMDQKKKTENGFEIHFGVNHIGHHYLISLLKDKILKDSSRIVMVASSLLNVGQIDMELKDFVEEGRPHKNASWIPTGYADSKLMNALMAKQYASVGLQSISLCPGWCKTDLGRSVPLSLFNKFVMFFVSSLFRKTSTKGSETLIHGAFANDIVNGAVYADCKISDKMNSKLEGLLETGNQLHSLSDELITSKLNSRS